MGILLSTEEGKENPERNTQRRERASGRERGWRGRTQRDVGIEGRCRSECVAGNGAEIRGDPIKARTHPSLQASLLLNIYLLKA